MFEYASRKHSIHQLEAYTFTESGTNKIGRLEPATNIITEWETSGNDTTKAAPTGIAFDTTIGSIYFIERDT